ncbi:uncharacterized protein BO87DRAFT_311576 [Aspergillus neoniger CBS 115656]|uniref:Uncharacterized protein n=1 Tax=Aspergillus neoniger (strain CBS 115656) TaxID=1448310 RepID=A0A318YGV4_ASPNB|nr:hypothetical protein BO87DRAFT_311576 [Aspergillus neoniger CBS 115656]PYH32947.1 hypothetical protein BO87DRAFT_311576 [Aspergillus neoniger CBS 115656]
MIRYKPTRIALGDEDLRYHLERLLIRHSRMAEWHRQDLDRDSYSDDSVAFLGSDFFSPYNLSPGGSVCSSGPDSPSQGSWQSNQDCEVGHSGLSSLFNETDDSLSVVVQDEMRTMSTCSSGLCGPLSEKSSRTGEEHHVTETTHQLSLKTIDSSQLSGQSPGKRGLEMLHPHSLTCQPLTIATVPSINIPASVFSKNGGRCSIVPHRHSISHPLLLGTRELNRETLSCSTQSAGGSLDFIDTSDEVENLRQTWSRFKVQDSDLRPSLDLEIRSGSTCVNLAAQQTQLVDFLARPSSRPKAALEVIKMPGADISTRKTRGQRANLSLPGSAAVHHNGPGERSGAEITKAPVALPTRLQNSARPRSTGPHRSNPIRRAPRNIVSHGTQTETEQVSLLPEQDHGGTVTHQAVNSSLTAPAEGVQNHGYEHNPPQEHMVREAPAISGLLRNMRFQKSQNANRINLIASMPSANPPVPGGRGSMAAPHDHRSEPCMDTRASVNPYLKEAMEFDSYVTFMTDELYEKVEVDVKDYGPTILGLTQQLSSQGNC